MILVGTNDISRGSEEQEALWESMMVCLFTTLWKESRKSECRKNNPLGHRT